MRIETGTFDKIMAAVLKVSCGQLVKVVGIDRNDQLFVLASTSIAIGIARIEQLSGDDVERQEVPASFVFADL